MDVNTTCPRCAAQSPSIVRDGFFWRADDSKKIQRYQCKTCGKKFSAATDKPAYRQKCRRINSTVRLGLAFNMCQRDIALLTNVNVKTVAARLVWQAKLSREKNKRFIDQYIKRYGPITTVQLDDLITFEHTKCKPLTVPVAVIAGTRVPLAFGIASIPASGHLAATARNRYGKREDNSRQVRETVFEQLTHILPPEVHFETDGHDHYRVLIKRFFPQATHTVFPSVRGAVVGQGELKKIHFDPLFTINHFLATMRAKVNRLVRRTWCTTKDPERLSDHTDVMIDVFCDHLQRLWLRDKGVCPLEIVSCSK